MAKVLFAFKNRKMRNTKDQNNLHFELFPSLSAFCTAPIDANEFHSWSTASDPAVAPRPPGGYSLIGLGPSDDAINIVGSWMGPPASDTTPEFNDCLLEFDSIHEQAREKETLSFRNSKLVFAKRANKFKNSNGARGLDSSRT
jgi:hypothetical protein